MSTRLVYRRAPVAFAAAPVAGMRGSVGNVNGFGSLGGDRSADLFVTASGMWSRRRAGAAATVGAPPVAGRPRPPAPRQRSVLETAGVDPEARASARPSRREASRRCARGDSSRMPAPRSTSRPTASATGPGRRAHDRKPARARSSPTPPPRGAPRRRPRARDAERDDQARADRARDSAGCGRAGLDRGRLGSARRCGCREQAGERGGAGEVGRGIRRRIGRRRGGVLVRGDARFGSADAGEPRACDPPGERAERDRAEGEQQQPRRGRLGHDAEQRDAGHDPDLRARPATTDVPAPTAKPGPATNESPHTTSVGRYASCARVTTVAPSASRCAASYSAMISPPRRIERHGGDEGAESDEAGDDHGGSARDEPGRLAPSVRHGFDPVPEPRDGSAARLAPLGHDRRADRRQREDERRERARPATVRPPRRRSPRSARRACRAPRRPAVPVTTPVTQASACEARTPDRAAKIAVNAAKSERGEREGEGCRVRIDSDGRDVVGGDRHRERHEVAELPDDGARRPQRVPVRAVPPSRTPTAP